ncbi:esterase/lipase family protein [Geodermatophilus sp. URMC 61]|uniref:esterase/lipase family protein n=1 Tax=Geodermatophilus sp. URMC 61 TaxID=3423411 RepID=UPI00406CA2A9
MKLPIVYVRGYAGGTSGIDRAVDDPLYGFNEGSVHVRVGASRDPVFYQFESPLLRLIGDDGYRLLVEGGQLAYLRSRADESVPEASIWVHRFYDVSASTFGRHPEEFSIEKAAEDLFQLVQLVLQKTGAPRVHLVAHSMGGLVCRSMIQRVIPDRGERAEDYVERLFTYGTPHDGIELAVGWGVVEGLRDLFDVQGAAVFGPERMYEYLSPRTSTSGRSDGPPPGWRAAEMPEDGFPLGRVFCLVGTNPEDYDVAAGLSSKAVGVRSDGLVQIDNAYVPGAHRAFVHRSHSGRYGMVNSEEGYQNLRRFLFGDLEVTAEFAGLRVRGAADDDIVWQLETQLSIRGLPILMHEQTTAHHCPVQIEWRREEDTADTPVPLLTTFLSTRAPRPVVPGTDTPVPRLRHALRLRLISVRQSGGVFGFFDHLEQTADWEDTLVVDIEPGDGEAPPRAFAAWNSVIPGALRDWQPDKGPLTDEEPEPGLWRGRIPVPVTARPILGQDAAVLLTVHGRT